MPAVTPAAAAQRAGHRCGAVCGQAAKQAALALALLWLPASAAAHTRWFTTVADAVTPPLPLTRVFGSPVFLALFMATLAIMAIVQSVDTLLRQRRNRATGLLDRVDDCMTHTAAPLLRFALALYFLCIAAFFHDEPITLTPDLAAGGSWVIQLQVLVAGGLLFRRSVIPACLGIVLLYVHSADLHGWVRLMDYLLFLGACGFLVLDRFSHRLGASTGLLVLRLLVGASFLWVGIEKWLYPHWTLDVLVNQLPTLPMLMMGIDPDFYVMGAGFVEVALAFLVLFGGVSAQVAAAVLMGLLAAGIPLAARVDGGIGHLPMLAILFVLATTRNHLAEHLRQLAGKRPLGLSGTFVITVPGVVGLYFLTHQLAAAAERHGYSGNVSLSLLWCAVLVTWACHALARELRRQAEPVVHRRPAENRADLALH
jgi:uncharacterized membrane protein YphA (DoxX/SURF4 family)